MSALDYEIDGQTYEGYFVKPAGVAKAPVVAIAHAWGGLGDNEKQKAEIISREFGYAAFAMDVYGKGKRGVSVEECQALMNPLVGNRAELQKRLAGGLAAAKSQVGVDASKAAAIGFCFGGLSVLDMARAGHDLLGVAAFHGLFRPAENIPQPKIKAKVLIEHGWLDPMATPQDVLAIAREFDGADWQLHAHGKAVHAFTTLGANNAAMGTVYDADADRRSFAYLKTFLAELFG
ncbi:MAG: dienelactone hydrolase family protein [Hyphomonas sp.]|uniref:dienelactone hydrolase family protein n=1 Tax=Hyphomonas sp. TaxID=87 RepID=UPI0017F5EBC6|nr:dienelactone hydrolase family protein [Hyphomonas sp.]MBA3067173.1 dienelactone hydrolase family protein [Hyphomonas sp.]MBU3921215.1 dienelactone hydrolase family protein [Alphaproteobacteria bacterium]MBU4061217.1 dienelactone hydrolase family protein [Alphaproteobacteria bacterium]MBU4165129.1 dienelactone hydrolase family protein [Alphaproteobacteria bacterium]